VIQVAADGIYLDRGGFDGLVLGSRIDVNGTSGEAVDLTVTRLSDHHAVASPPAEAGALAASPVSPGAVWRSTVEMPTPPPDSIRAVVTTMAPVNAATIAEGWKTALAEPAPLRPYHGAGKGKAVRGNEAGWIRVTPAGVAFPYSSGGSSTYAGGLLTVLGLAPLSRGGALRLNADCDLLDWAKRPAPDRLRPTANGSILLHALAIAYMPPKSGLSLAVGRARPATAAGAPIVDGGALSWGSTSRHAGMRSRAFGAYGGYIPDALTLAPNRDRLSLGAYGSAAGSVGSSLDGSVQGRLSLLHTTGVSREDGELLVGLGRSNGLAFDGGAAVAHATGANHLTDGWAGLRQRIGSSEISIRHRQSEPVLDPTQASAYREVLGALAATPGMSRHTEARFSGPGAFGGRLEAAVGHHDGADGFARWTGEARLAKPARFGPIRRWLAGYRGSTGWQAGHEGELGCGLALSRWTVDVSAGGGRIHQSKANLTNFIGRGTLGVRRPLGSNGSLSLFARGEKEAHSFAAAGTLAFSWQFRGWR
jgi:hypothetical protein